jgi:UDP-N-acetylmuramate dehydrogenase
MAVIDDLRQRVSPEVKENIVLAPLTTFRIGGPAEFFFEAKSADGAVKAVAAARELGLPCFVMGGGSNLLIADEGIKGLVIRMDNRGMKIDGMAATVEAGEPMAMLALKTVEAGLSGLEWAAGLPGTLGGAIRGNAGMFGGDMKGSVESVRALVGGETKEVAGVDCQFEYRSSFFKKNHGSLILSAVLRLEPCVDINRAKGQMTENIRKKAATQPMDKFTAGCVFMNWRPSNPDEEIPIIRKSLDLNKEEVIPFTPDGAIPAGWILDRAQLKGMRVGHTVISDKHANFFVNEGGGTASEIIALTAAVKMKVRDMTHGIIELLDEIEYAGF